MHNMESLYNNASRKGAQSESITVTTPAAAAAITFGIENIHVHRTFGKLSRTMAMHTIGQRKWKMQRNKHP